MSVSDICGDFPPEVDGTVCKHGDVSSESMEMSPDSLEAVGVHELFVAVTVDASFTTEQAVVGHIDEIHVLIAVRTATIVGYLSPSQICDACDLLRSRSAPWCVRTSSLSFSI